VDIQAEKLDLIQWLVQLSDENLIRKISALRNERMDSSIKISNEEKLEIEEGKNDIKEGRYYTHEQVMSNVEDRFDDLLK
jgi:predicted transcriptional regulator